MKFAILVGPSGAGKSTFAQQFAGPGLVICSADDYFLTEEGEYVFEPARLGEAHAACFRKAVEAVVAGKSVLIDNTNTTLVELAPYIALSRAYGEDPYISVFRPSPKLTDAGTDAVLDFLMGRARHGAPRNRVAAQCRRLRETLAQWPPLWPPFASAYFGD